MGIIYSFFRRFTTPIPRPRAQPTQQTSIVEYDSEPHSLNQRQQNTSIQRNDTQKRRIEEEPRFQDQENENYGARLEQEQITKEQERQLEISNADREREEAKALRASLRKLKATEREERERLSNAKVQKELSAKSHNFQEKAQQNENEIDRHRQRKLEELEENVRQIELEREAAEKQRLENRKKQNERNSEISMEVQDDDGGIESYREELTRMSQSHKANLEGISNQTNTEIQVQNDLTERDRQEIQYEKTSLAEELENMDRKTREDQERSDEMWEDRRRKMKEQDDLFTYYLKMKVWNDAVENNWTNRLKFLRSANREVERKCNLLCTAMSENHIQNPKFHQILDMRLLDLQKSLSSLSTLMRKEIDNLKHMHEKFGKEFIQDIIASLILVVDACDQFENSLRFEVKQIDYENIQATKYHIASNNADLVDAVNRIPTLSQLKSNFAGMNNASSNSTQQLEDVESSTIIIEEIE